MDTNIDVMNILEELKDILEKRHAHYHSEMEGMADPMSIIGHSTRLDEISYVLGCIELLQLVKKDKDNTEEL